MIVSTAIVIFLSSYSIFYVESVINTEILEFMTPASCKEEEYFDAQSLSCMKCETAKNLKPSDNRFKCICDEHSRLISLENGKPSCEACPVNTTKTDDGKDCIRCSDNNCQCSDNHIQVERHTNGTLYDAIRCLPCPQNFYPSVDRLKCIPCSNVTSSRHPNCGCPVTSHLRIQDNCFSKSGLPDWPDVRATYLIEFRRQSIDSYYFRANLQLAFYKCKNGDQEICEHLSNMCALMLFKENEACKPFLQKYFSPSWLFYEKGEAPTILTGKQISQKYSLARSGNNSMLNFTFAIFSLSGELQSIGIPNMPCRLLRNEKFGVNLNKQCQITAKELLSTRMDFYVPYLSYQEKDNIFLHALPVLIKNIAGNEADVVQWQLVRKFFLVDSVTGFQALPSSINTSFKKDPEISVVRYMKSLCIVINAQNKKGHGKIHPPLFIVEYDELSKQDVTDNIEVTVDYTVKFLMAEDDRDTVIHICVGVLAGFAMAFSGIKTWVYCRRNYNGAPNAQAILWFSVHCFGTIGNVLLLVSLSTCIYTFIFYKGQSVLHVLLPDDSIEKIIRICTIIAFCFKAMELISFVYQLQKVNIFFIDWEQPKTIQNEHNYDSPHTSLRKTYSSRFAEGVQNSSSRTPSEIIAARRNRTPSKLNGGDSPSKRSRLSSVTDQFERENSNIFSEMTYSQRNDISSTRNQQNPFSVSIWRTYFIANEWLSIQTRRKVNILLQGMFTLLLLEVIDLDSWTSATPELRSIGKSSDISKSYTLHYAVCSLTYISVYCVQWTISLSLYERYVRNQMQQFVDLCSIANVSIFILSLNYYGFYIHGRSVHGFADTDLRTLIDDLQKEENNLCAHRGLIPGTTDQTFIMLVTPKFRNFYDKYQDTKTTSEGRIWRKDDDDARNWDKNLEIRETLRKFLVDFLDHCFPDTDYVVKERHFLEKLCDFNFIEATEKTTFYIDNNHAFDCVMFYGNEWILASFDVTLLIFILTLCEKHTLAVIAVIFVSQFVTIIAKYIARGNLATKALIDKRFLM